MVVAAFLLAILAVCGLAVTVLIGGIVRRLMPDLAWLPRMPRAVRWTVLGLALFGVACMAYGYFAEPYWLDVSHVHITTPNLPASVGPLRIVHISDLHCDAAPRLEEGLPGVIGAEAPDIIVFTGDAVNSAEGLPVFRACMSRVASLAPTFAVTGNWDEWYWGRLDLFGGTGVRVLHEEAVELRLRGMPVWVAGVRFGEEDRIGWALRQVPAGAFTLLLCHSPDSIADVARYGVDVCLAGHTHGGQVALPLYGALVTLSRTGKRYEAGLYRVSNTWLYVNRGIGMEGGLPRVRFFSRPEVAVIQAVPEAS